MYDILKMFILTVTIFILSDECASHTDELEKFPLFHLVSSRSTTQLSQCEKYPCFVIIHIVHTYIYIHQIRGCSRLCLGKTLIVVVLLLLFCWTLNGNAFVRIAQPNHHTIKLFCAKIDLYLIEFGALSYCCFALIGLICFDFFCFCQFREKLCAAKSRWVQMNERKIRCRKFTAFRCRTPNWFCARCCFFCSRFWIYKIQQMHKHTQYLRNSCQSIARASAIPATNKALSLTYFKWDSNKWFCFCFSVTCFFPLISLSCARAHTPHMNSTTIKTKFFVYF